MGYKIIDRKKENSQEINSGTMVVVRMMIAMRGLFVNDVIKEGE